MSKIAVVYKSKYGATKKYAGWIAKELDAELLEAGKTDPAGLGAYDGIVYGGGLYAGGIAGLKPFTKKTFKNLAVFTVGLADPAETDYSEQIRMAFGPELPAGVKVFHLRGDMDYGKLSPLHRVMMSVMKSSIAKRPESERNAEDKLFLETYGGKMDFVDKESIVPLVEHMRTVAGR